ncbi:hypothetical protein KUCAC02_025358 [Chaenocephalus aceratus]|uniref:Uncharacterized protein n=1 Tax=Chaenocephalus aceratus TaxID=36190 RepID=A0ACB9VTJ9_CHAAC|nr:hypothetical protein KUCAC02_025358 [Chaenocephalus aceratus]
MLPHSTQWALLADLSPSPSLPLSLPLSLSLSQDMKESYTGMSHSGVGRVRTHHSQRPHSHPVHPAISLKHRHTPFLSIIT